MSQQVGSSSGGDGHDRGSDLGLGGRLPCAVCKYNLQGLSILGVCPECGTAVRATILAAVDPYAEELRPQRWPWVVATGLLAWSGAAMVAALAGWRLAFERLAPLWHDGLVAARTLDGWMWAIVVMLTVSAVGAAVFVVFHRADRRGHVWLGLAGAVAYVPLAIALGRLHGMATGAAPGTDTLGQFWQPAPERTLLRLAVCASMLAALFCLRPTARSLVARSLVMRTGRVDRQTILAMAAACGVLMLGDLSGLAGRRMEAGGDAFEIVGMVMMIAGALLMTLGLLGAVVDCVRIAQAILAPSPGLGEVLEGERPGGTP